MKRYAVLANFYIYAENEEQAKEMAKKWAEDFQKAKDNQATVISLHDAPFGSTATREIEISNS